MMLIDYVDCIILQSMFDANRFAGWYGTKESVYSLDLIILIQDIRCYSLVIKYLFEQFPSLLKVVYSGL
mgnify:CR=1 FL=1